MMPPCSLLHRSCCQSDRVTFGLPTTCFERHGCYGLHWIGARACSPALVEAVAAQIRQELGQEAARPRFGQAGVVGDGISADGIFLGNPFNWL